MERRGFLTTSSLALLGLGLQGPLAAGQAGSFDPTVDIHQHVNHHGRSDEALIAHQRAMGISIFATTPTCTAISPQAQASTR